MVERNSARTVCLSNVVHISLIVNWWNWWPRRTLSKQTVQGPSNTLYTPVLDSGQHHTPSIHRLYSIHWGHALGHASGWPQHWLWAIISDSPSWAHSHKSKERKDSNHYHIYTQNTVHRLHLWCIQAPSITYCLHHCSKHHENCNCTQAAPVMHSGTSYYLLSPSL